MYEAIEALEALKDLGTMGKAAARLRITQSAVSKRIATLETTLGTELIERSGRRVQLTAEGNAFLSKAQPLIHELNGLIQFFEKAPQESEKHGKIILGVADSVLSSWGPALFQRILKKMPGLTLEMHAHRSRFLVEHVRSGDYMLGFSPDPMIYGDLVTKTVLEEPMVIIPSGLDKLHRPKGAPLEVISIESSSATGAILKDRLKRFAASSGGFPIEWKIRVESFSSVVQMARAGFGHGLVPIGIARAMGVPTAKMIHLKLSRPISLIGRTGIMARPLVRHFSEALIAEAETFPATRQ